MKKAERIETAKYVAESHANYEARVAAEGGRKRNGPLALFVVLLASWGRAWA
jgi:hypothetical protein